MIPRKFPAVATILTIPKFQLVNVVRLERSLQEMEYSGPPPPPSFSTLRLRKPDRAGASEEEREGLMFECDVTAEDECAEHIKVSLALRPLQLFQYCTKKNATLQKWEWPSLYQGTLCH